MKKTLKYLPFLAALAFVGCSSDDVPANNGGGGEGDGYGYVAVNIMSSAGTRAEDFVDGTDDENKASEGLFFIFDASGNTIHGNAQRISFTGPETENPANDNIEKLYSTVLVVDGVTPDPNLDNYQIVCVLNAPEGLENNVSTLSALTSKIADYKTNCTNAGTFIMTNSVYKNGTDTVVGAKISKVYNSATEAYANPVDIYVERVVAKIKMRKADAFSNNTDESKKYISIDGTKTEFKIVPTGVALVNLADKSYLFKDITGIDATWTWWNDAANYRSYWEVVPTIVTTGDTDTSNNMDYTKNDKKYSDIGKTDFNIDNYTPTEEYVQPNTVAANDTECRQTALVMTAKLQAVDGTALTGEKTLAYIRGGYTTSSKALEVVGKYLASTKGWYMRTGTEGSYTYVPFDKTALEWKNNADLGETDKISGLKRYEVVAQLKTDAQVYNADGTPVTDDVNAYLRSDAAKGYYARVFTDGMCYYYVYVQHYTETPTSEGATEPTTTVYNGVVRNHVYDLALTSVNGVGVPVFDPSDVIIPEKVEDQTTFYLGATVNVLAWRQVATQNVEF